MKKLSHISSKPILIRNRWQSSFYLLSMKEPDFMSDLAWLSTHPTSEDRAKEIMGLISSADKASFTEALSESSWKELQQLLSDKETDNY